MICSRRIVGFVAALSFVPLIFTAQVTWDFPEPIDVADSDFGNRCPRLVLDASGDPVVFMGKTNEGLFVVTSENGTFNPPTLVPTETDIFLSDAEGPDVATWGNSVGLAYQISGQWATGARFMRSDDGGSTWSAPHPIAPNATVDHFMPIPAFDDNGNPFVALKLGSGDNAQEGVLRSSDGGETWGDAQVASLEAGNGIACECCPSRTIYGNGRYHTLYRRNNNDTRDLWMVSSEDGVTWDQALDLDPTDWQISACPETGASSEWLPNGHLASVFMSAGEGSSKIYCNVSDPASNSNGLTVPLSTVQFDSPSQNQPDLAVGPNHTAVAWQQNLSGWDIMLSIAANSSVPSGLTNVAINVSEGASGSNRHPDLAIHGNTLHLIWQNSASGTVKYLRGTLGDLSSTAALQHPDQPQLLLKGSTSVELVNAMPSTPYLIFQTNGSVLYTGQTNAMGTATLPTRFVQSGSPIMLVQAQGKTAPTVLKLGGLK